MLLIVVVKRLADTLGSTLPILRAYLSTGFLRLLLQGISGYGRQSQTQILQEVLFQGFLVPGSLLQSLILLLEQARQIAPSLLQNDTLLFRLLHPAALRFDLLLQFRALARSVPVFRPVQEVLYHLNLRPGNLHLLLKLRNGLLLGTFLVTKLRRMIFADLDLFGQMKQIVIADCQCA